MASSTRRASSSRAPSFTIGTSACGARAASARPAPTSGDARLRTRHAARLQAGDAHVFRRALTTRARPIEYGGSVHHEQRRIHDGDPGEAFASPVAQRSFHAPAHFRVDERFQVPDAPRASANATRARARRGDPLSSRRAPARPRRVQSGRDATRCGSPLACGSRTDHVGVQHQARAPRSPPRAAPPSTFPPIPPVTLSTSMPREGPVPRQWASLQFAPQPRSTTRGTARSAAPSMARLARSATSSRSPRDNRTRARRGR